MRVSSNKYIVSLIGVSLPPDTAIISEYIEGRSLLYHLLDAGDHSFNPTRILELLSCIAYGMRSLHRSEVLHLNLAAHNVLIAPDGTPKISDYGLRGITKSRTYGPRWKAPEYIRTFRASWKSDVWSYGMVISELLSRNIPFPYDTNIKVVDLVVHKRRVPDIPKDTPPQIKKLFEMCLQYDYRNRPSFDDICKEFDG
eukprot:TRINITY_DN7572_c0_g1_i1.p1 TRINITY_DN7572_c0_g1~~TRINITY_DN7572_c0_g1_i1.p1  ORF type:complete len:198 (+),score=18.52 TRINITY_DN7572_c0_g1_i1:381-974(+)